MPKVILEVWISKTTKWISSLRVAQPVHENWIPKAKPAFFFVFVFLLMRYQTCHWAKLFIKMLFFKNKKHFHCQALQVKCRIKVGSSVIWNTTQILMIYVTLSKISSLCFRYHTCKMHLLRLIHSQPFCCSYLLIHFIFASIYCILIMQYLARSKKKRYNGLILLSIYAQL